MECRSMVKADERNVKSRTENSYIVRGVNAGTFRPRHGGSVGGGEAHNYSIVGTDGLGPWGFSPVPPALPGSAGSVDPQLLDLWSM
jgi:hypothetical protein